MRQTERKIREKIKSCLKAKCGSFQENNFEFIKVNQKRISVLQLAQGTEYNFSVVRELAGQGLLYVRIKKDFQFVLGQPSSQIEEDDPPPHQSSISSSHETLVIDVDDVHEAGSFKEIIQKDFKSCLIDDFPAEMTDPLEMLCYIQKKLLKGRQLNITDLESSLEGDVYFIFVDRENILCTAIDELTDIKDFCLTFEVQFYEEEAADSGGPRREWISLCNQKIKENYFDAGLKEFLSNDYYVVGVITAIALVQGPVPKYFPDNVLHKMFLAENDSSMYKYAQKGFGCPWHL